MEQTTLKSFYDELFESFHSDCIEIGHLEHLAGTDVFVIAVGVKEQITSLITYLNQGQEKPDHIYMIVQKNMIPVVSDLENEQCHFIEWNGPYTLDVIRYVEERINLTAVRHLFYQGRQPLDLRNVNLYDILLGIKNKYKNNCVIHLYMQDIQEHVHWYSTPERIRKGMDVYQAIDAYLEE